MAFHPQYLKLDALIPLRHASSETLASDATLLEEVDPGSIHESLDTNEPDGGSQSSQQDVRPDDTATGPSQLSEVMKPAPGGLVSLLSTVVINLYLKSRASKASKNLQKSSKMVLISRESTYFRGSFVTCLDLILL